MVLRTVCGLAPATILVLSTAASADIFRWDNQQLIPGTEGIVPGPAVDLHSSYTKRLDLSFAALQGLNLTGGSLSGTNLSSVLFHSSTLRGADLGYTNLTQANFSYADLTRTRISGTLTGANFVHAIIDGANFTGFRGEGQSMTVAQLQSTATWARGTLQQTQFSTTDFTGASFTRKDLNHAALVSCNLQGVTFDHSNLEAIRLEGSTLTGASFVGANLFRGKLGRADYTRADFSGANLAHASFLYHNSGTTKSYPPRPFPNVPSNLTGANFSHAVIEDVDFTESTLTNADFTQATLRYSLFDRAMGFTPQQLYSTRSYATHDLTSISLDMLDLRGWNFSRMYLASTIQYVGISPVVPPPGSLPPLTGDAMYATSFIRSNLAGADFSGACLYYAVFSDANLAGVNFQGADLTRAALYRASLRNADLRGTISFVPDISTNITNAIHPDGTIHGLDLVAGETFTVRNHSRPITLRTAATLDPAATLRFELGENWTSPVRFSPDARVELDGILQLDLANQIAAESILDKPIRLFAWHTPPASRFDAIITGGGLTWDTSALYTTGFVQLVGISAQARTPEPASLALLLPALLAMRRHRRRSRYGA